jgi:UDP-N-acetylmuramate: L-alanyl-gamma-D-glutamyl-meso-diaminopimelate ligase
MKHSKEVKSIHFTGICGTAMASVAALLKERGFRVTGSDDNVYPPMSTFLESRGIRIIDGYNAENLDQKPDLIVIGNALRRGTPEVERALEERLSFCSLPEVVRKFLLQNKHSIVVSGTHGKTTTAAMLAWLYTHAGLKPGFLIGGIPLNFGHGAATGDGKHFIVEGDEYDTAFFDKRSKFIHYVPDTVIINNIEFDHADIFEDLEAVKKAFRQLIAVVPRNGTIVANSDDANVRELVANAFSKVLTFGFGEDADVRAVNARASAEHSEFQIALNLKAAVMLSAADYPAEFRFKLPLTGHHNIQNALAAATVALSHGLTPRQIQNGFATFKGVKRRLEVRGEAAGVTVLDDFAHHPTAIAATLEAVRQRYPARRVWALFEPRSNTTRRHFFQRELAIVLSEADGVVIGKVDRLQELAESERLNPELIVDAVRLCGKPAFYLPDAGAIVETLKTQLQQGDVVAVFSNGKFDGVHEKLLAALSESAGGSVGRDERVRPAIHSRPQSEMR